MRSAFLAALFCAGCAPALAPTIDPLPDLDYPWAACAIDPNTGLTSPNCEESDPAILQLAILLREDGQPGEGLEVTVRSLAEDIFVVHRDQLEAVAHPDDPIWTSSPLLDQVWAETTGGTSEDPPPQESTFFSDEYGIATAFVLIWSPPKDHTGAAVPSTIQLETAVDDQTITLTPIGGGAR